MRGARRAAAILGDSSGGCAARPDTARLQPGQLLRLTRLKQLDVGGESTGDMGQVTVRGIHLPGGHTG